MIVMAYTKDEIYHDQCPRDMFLPFVLEVFNCLNQQANNFLSRCVNVVSSTKGIKSPPLSILQIFYRQKVAIALQRAQASSILRWVVAANEAFF
jgi:hypothetical protein